MWVVLAVAVWIVAVRVAERGDARVRVRWRRIDSYRWLRRYCRCSIRPSCAAHRIAAFARCVARCLAEIERKWKNICTVWWRARARECVCVCVCISFLVGSRIRVCGTPMCLFSTIHNEFVLQVYPIYTYKTWSWTTIYCDVMGMEVRLRHCTSVFVCWYPCSPCICTCILRVSVPVCSLCAEQCAEVEVLFYSFFSYFIYFYFFSSLCIYNVQLQVVLVRAARVH